jgi:hypothetical protein
MWHEDFECRKGAAWVVINILVNGTAQQLMDVFQIGGVWPMPALCDLLKCRDQPLWMEERFGAEILGALTGLLTVASQKDFLDQASYSLMERAALDTLVELQDHHDQDIAEKASYILETFF